MYEKTSSALATAAVQQVNEPNGPELANMASMFATAVWSEEKLCVTVVYVQMRRCRSCVCVCDCRLSVHERAFAALATNAVEQQAIEFNK